VSDAVTRGTDGGGVVHHCLYREDAAKLGAHLWKITQCTRQVRRPTGASENLLLTLTRDDVTCLACAATGEAEYDGAGWPLPLRVYGT
jgi:hypothetical protein